MRTNQQPKSPEEIDALIRQQLAQNGFNEQGVHQSMITDSDAPFSSADFEFNHPNAVEDSLSEQAEPVKPLRPKREKEIDSRFIRLEELPSDFLPYPDRDYLMVRPFSVKELKLIARSIETGNVDYITQAIDNCIDSRRVENSRWRI